MVSSCGWERAGLRVVDKFVAQLAEELLFGDLTEGGIVKVDVKENEIVFEYTQERPSKSKKPTKKETVK